MRSINKTYLQIGETDIPISIYSAVEQETRFKQISACCNAPVKYKRVCGECGKELDFSEIKKALDVGELKEVNTEKIKIENTTLKILGITEDSEENGVFKDGTIWFIGMQKGKNKAITERNLIKYAYLKEALKESRQTLLGLIAVRGKEHIVLLKPYFDGLIGLGVYHLDRIRDIREIAGYLEMPTTDKDAVKQIAEKIKQKDRVAIKDIKNKREQLIMEALESVQEKAENSNEEKSELNPVELCNF